MSLPTDVATQHLENEARDVGGRPEAGPQQDDAVRCASPTTEDEFPKIFVERQENAPFRQRPCQHAFVVVPWRQLRHPGNVMPALPSREDGVTRHVLVSKEGCHGLVKWAAGRPAGLSSPRPRKRGRLG